MRRCRLTRRWAALGLLAGLAIALPSLGLSACSCGPVPEVGLALDEAQEVFAGRVVALELVAIHDVDPTSSFAPEHLKVTFTVHSLWKGEIEELATVYTGFACCVCGFPFEIGEEYLVYTYPSTDGLSYTSICMRTKSLLDASDDLGALGQLAPRSLKPPESEGGDI